MDSSFPILETSRMKLRPVREADADDLFQYFSNDQVTEYYDIDSLTNVEQAKDIIARFKKRYEDQQGIRWGITFKDDHRIIGTIGFHNWKRNNYKAEIGYELSSDYWGQGIMTEVLQEILKYGFETMKLHRIEAIIYQNNKNSRRVLEKSGFHEEGLLRDNYYKKNQFENGVIFSVLEREYVMKGIHLTER